MVKCFICGVGEGVVEFEFSDSFVTYGDVFNGRMVCRTCHDLVRDQKFRRSSWVLAGGHVRILDRQGLLDALLNAPEGSIVYVRSRGQKLTFLKALRHRTTKNYVVVCGEDEGVVIARRERVRTFVERAREAHSLGIRKTEMLEGCSTRSWTHKEVCDFIEGVRGDPLWRIVVRAL